MSDSNERSPCLTSERASNATGVAARAPLAQESAGVRITADQLAEAARRIGIPVEIDDSGWVRERAALRYSAGPDRTIQAIAIRTSPNTTIAKLVQLGVPARCARYNAALDELRALRHRLHRLAAQNAPAQGSSLADALRHFTALTDAITRRQHQRMGSGTVDLDILLEEAIYWERFHEHFATIIARAERDAR